MQRTHHEVTRDGRLHRDGRRFPVADLADHDNVGVLTQNGTQGVAKGQVRLGIHLHLIHAVHVRLHGVLHRDDVHHVAVKLVQCGVKRGGFTGAGRSGDQHDPVGMAQDLVEFFQFRPRQAKGALAAAQRLFLRQSHHALFAIDRGERGNTHIVFPAVHQDGKAAVLRSALFGNVQIAEDLNARDDGGQQLQVVSGGGVQHAVHSAADPDLVRSGLHVDIGSALAHRLLHKGVHQHHHGGGVDILLKDLIFQRGALPLVGLGVKLGSLLHLLAAVAAVDGHENVGCCR